MMKDFNFHAPTRVVFGRSAEEQIGALAEAMREIYKMAK